MSEHRVLLLDSSQLTVYRVGRGLARTEGRFDGSTAGLADFGNYLAGQRASLFSLLVDTAEEGFQVENIPRVSGKDRQVIIQRKLAQHFYGTPYVLAHSIGRRREGRRDERLLLMGLTQPQWLQPWLSLLGARKAILRGIYSVPQIIAALPLGTLPGRLLLVTRSLAGLRQTYFHDGAMRYSRLTPLIAGNADQIAEAAALEAFKLHQYLSSQRIIDPNQALPTWLLIHPDQVPAMQAHCRNTAALQFDSIDLPTLARRAGLRAPLPDSRAEILFCHWLGKKPPAQQFAPPEKREHYRLWQTRFAMNVASATLFGASLLFATDRSLDILRLRQGMEETRERIQLDSTRYDAKMRELPKIPLGTEDLRALTDRYAFVIQRAQGPRPLLTQLSEALDAFPEITLDRIEWSAAEQLAPAPPPDTNAGDLAGVAQTGPFAQAIVAARLPLAIAGNQRAQLEVVERFMLHLRRSPDTFAILRQAPVESRSGQTFKSSDVNSPAEAPKFQFLLAKRL